MDAPPTAIATLAPVPTPDDVPSVVQVLSRVLASGNASQLSPFLFDSVWVALENDASGGQSLSRDSGVAWLKEHWGTGLALTATRYARDSAMLGLTTTGWPIRTPLEKGIIEFNLHRYDARGGPADIGGTWRIDTILYQ